MSKKLTLGVFNRPDCPEWANYAAVNKSGYAYWFEHKPEICGGYWVSSPSTKFLIGIFDPDGWEKSLIYRESPFEFQ